MKFADSKIWGSFSRNFVSRVYPLCGNCDYIDRVFLEGGSPDPAFSVQMNERLGVSGHYSNADQELWPVLEYWVNGVGFLQLQHKAQDSQAVPALFQQVAHQDEHVVRREADPLLDYFPRETKFLLKLPHILESANFIFVHGGIPREDNLDGLLQQALQAGQVSMDVADGDDAAARLNGRAYDRRETVFTGPSAPRFTAPACPSCAGSSGGRPRCRRRRSGSPG